MLLRKWFENPWFGETLGETSVRRPQDLENNCDTRVRQDSWKTALSLYEVPIEDVIWELMGKL